MVFTLFFNRKIIAIFFNAQLILNIIFEISLSDNKLFSLYINFAIFSDKSLKNFITYLIRYFFIESMTLRKK